VNNIEINLKEIGYEGVDWIYLAQVGTSDELLWTQLFRVP
jgi:hypothetical protein